MDGIGSPPEHEFGRCPNQILDYSESVMHGERNRYLEVSISDCSFCNATGLLSPSRGILSTSAMQLTCHGNHEYVTIQSAVDLCFRHSESMCDLNSHLPY